MAASNAQNELRGFGRCSTRSQLQLTVFTFLAFFAVFAMLFWFRNATQADSSGRQQLLVQQQQLLRQQRNDLSVALNKLQERYQQFVCLTQKQNAISQTGGYCGQAVKAGHMTDVPLADALSEFFAGKTVVSLGDGRGDYRRRLLDAGKVKKYDSFDGAPFIENSTALQVRFLDLTLPQYWLPVYDWAISLEVIEHIPAQFESTVLDNIVRAAGEGVVLSWAVAGQGGFHHVNIQPLAHVDEVLERRGFKRDVAASEKLRKAASFVWLKRNVNVFRRFRANDE